MIRSTARPKTSRGLSLLELLVAFFIVALSLGLLYRSMGSSARQVTDMGQYQRALQLAESLLVLRESVTADGWNESGQMAGVTWQVSSSPMPDSAAPASASSVTDLQAIRLHTVNIILRWSEAGRERELLLSTALPQRQARPGEGGR